MAFPFSRFTINYYKLCFFPTWIPISVHIQGVLNYFNLLHTQATSVFEKRCHVGLGHYGDSAALSPKWGEWSGERETDLMWRSLSWKARKPQRENWHLCQGENTKQSKKKKELLSSTLRLMKLFHTDGLHHFRLLPVVNTQTESISSQQCLFLPLCFSFYHEC